MSGLACEAHRYHWPQPISTERHHVIPRAWQAYFHPESGGARTTASQARMLAATGAVALWDPRVTVLCPTGHRNVHRMIVRLMKTDTGEDFRRARDMVFGSRLSAEEGIALETLIRFQAAGGSLDVMRIAGLFGEG